MWILLAVTAVIVSPFIGYYLDYRDRPKEFIGWIKDWIKAYFSLIAWVGLLLIVALLLANFIGGKLWHVA